MFTKRRFLDFPLRQQHKKCAELLRKIYDCPSKELLDNYREIIEWLDEPPLEVIDQKTLSDRYHHHLKNSGISVAEHNLLPRIKTGDRKEPIAPLLPLSIYLENIRSAHNIGSILRTTEAFSLGDVYFSEQTPFIDHLQVQKTSMGSYKHLKCRQVSDHKSLINPLIVVETCEGSTSLHDYTFPETFTLAIGNEEYGCSEKLLMDADIIIEIPLKGRKNSLNVANAFAIIASEISKQKNKEPEDYYEH